MSDHTIVVIFVKYHVNNTPISPWIVVLVETTVEREGKSIARVSVCFTENQVQSLLMEVIFCNHPSAQMWLVLPGNGARMNAIVGLSDD